MSVPIVTGVDRRSRTSPGRALGWVLALATLLGPVQVARAGPDEMPGGSGRTFAWQTRYDITAPPEVMREAEQVRQARLRRTGVLEIDNDGMRGAWPPGAPGQRPAPSPPPGGGGSGG